MGKTDCSVREGMVQSEVVEAVKTLIKLRAGKKFDEAEKIRTELESLGITVEERKDGSVLLKKRDFINAMLIKER